METRTQGLVEALRQARLQKGWSQRDLGQKAHLTQAHLSRIESGAVDPKLSTVLELARLLDLEPVLAPRTALSAVSAVLREADAARQARSVRAAANALQQLAGSLRLDHASDPTVERLAELATGLRSLEPLFRTRAELAELLQINEQLQAGARHPGRGLTALKRGVDRLAQLRSQLVHPADDRQRPAYSLDDED